jgi:repressor LexA
MALTKKQKEFYDYIQGYFEKNGYAPTQKEIKEHFELKSFGSVQRYIKYLEDEGLLASDWNARRGLRPLPLSTDNDPLELPLLGLVAAGNPLEAIEHPDETIKVPAVFIRKNQRYFALRVQGDSMIEDGILPEDIVVCLYTSKAEPGEKVVAVVDGEATLKKYHPLKNSIELRPANARLKPILVSADQDFRICGVLVGLLRQY